MRVLSSISNAFSRILRRERNSAVQNEEYASIDELTEGLVGISQENDEGLRCSLQNEFLANLIILSKTSNPEKIWTRLIDYAHNSDDISLGASLEELMCIYKHRGYPLTKEMQQYLSASRYTH